MNDLLRKLVIAWDADQSDEFDEALVEARTLLGLTLAEDAEEQIATLTAEAEGSREAFTIQGKELLRHIRMAEAAEQMVATLTTRAAAAEVEEGRAKLLATQREVSLTAARGEVATLTQELDAFKVERAAHLKMGKDLVAWVQQIEQELRNDPLGSNVPNWLVTVADRLHAFMESIKGTR